MIFIRKVVVPILATFVLVGCASQPGRHLIKMGTPDADTLASKTPAYASEYYFTVTDNAIDTLFKKENGKYEVAISIKYDSLKAQKNYAITKGDSLYIIIDEKLRSLQTNGSDSSYKRKIWNENGVLVQFIDHPNEYKEFWDNGKLKIDLKGKNILILLDEAEVLFHPEWQRKYIINILEFFKVIFNGSSLQLLIATHSPIILSDIPKQNVLLLSKNSSNGYSYAEDNNKETFASNIYTLFKNSFFLDESGIGGFAFNKLEWIIEQIHSDNPDTNKILKYINLVGDPFIKDKLLQEYHYILDENEELSLLKKEKAKIEEKIAMLESEKHT